MCRAPVKNTDYSKHKIFYKVYTEILHYWHDQNYKTHDMVTYVIIPHCYYWCGCPSQDDKCLALQFNLNREVN